MKSYNIYNFEHGYRVPTEIDVDNNIKIIITLEHCNNLDKIFTNKKRRYKHDKNLVRYIEMDDESSYTWNITATILVKEDIIEQSRIAPGPNRSIVNDLCYLLSFYTGRMVCTDTDKDYYSFKKNTSSSIQIDRWPQYIKSYDEQIKLICRNKVNNTFYNILHLFQQTEIISQGFYSSAIINDFYSKWWGNQPKEIDKKISNTIKNKISIEIKKILQEELSQDLYDDIYMKFTNTLSNPSAHYQFHKFLTSFCLDDDNENIRKRIKSFNKIRNRIVHTGDLYREKNKSDEINVHMNINLIAILIDIIKVYFCQNILEITGDPQIIEYKEKLNTFFKDGKYNGMDIFDESFDDFYKRLDESWLENGVLPM